MSLFKNNWLTRLTGKSNKEEAERAAAQAAKEQAEKEAQELATKEQA
ncbi:MAG: hypothetical protein CFH32_01414, partial [Alphaproteobacteria bacterium MarineAlpha9_Bin2]